MQGNLLCPVANILRYYQLLVLCKPPPVEDSEANFWTQYGKIYTQQNIQMAHDKGKREVWYQNICDSVSKVDSELIVY